MQANSKIGVLLAAAMSATLLLTACGSGSAGSPDAPAKPGTFSTEILSLEELYKGTETDPPAEGPKPAAGKTVWWVSCGQAIVDCSAPAQAAEEAAEKLGWEFRIADGKLNVGGGQLAAAKQAVAARPDAIIVHGMSCPIVAAALQEAKKEKIPVIGVEALDCSDTGGPDLFTADMKYSAGAETASDYFQSWGVYGASYIINRAGEKAKIINNHGIEPIGEVVNQGFETTVSENCPNCKIVSDVKFSTADLAPNGPWVSAFRTALLNNTDATAVYYPYDANIVGAGGAAALQTSGGTMVSTGGSGSSSATDLVRQGQQTMVIAHSPEWLAWGAMDNLNRVFAGEPTVPQGVGIRVVDNDHNLPSEAGGSYESPIDWKAAYEASWSK